MNRVALLFFSLKSNKYEEEWVKNSIHKKLPLTTFKKSLLDFMKKIFFIILLLPIGIWAQKDKRIEPRNEDYITTDIVSPVFIHFNSDYSTPRWRLGYVKNLNEKTKVGIDIGYGNAHTSLIGTGNSYSLWEIRPEYYHILNLNRKTLKYVSFEMFYINQKEEFFNQSFFSDENVYQSFDKADYNRQKFGIIPKFGMFVHLSERLGMNFYSGIGLRYRINTYSDFINLRESYFDEEHFPPYYRREGNKLGVEFTFGMKLFYRVKS